MSRSDATLVCVRNDVTARSPALYNQTTRMVHHKVMSVSVYLHLQGLVFLQEIALKKKFWIIANISLNLFPTESELNSSDASLLPCHSPQHLQHALSLLVFVAFASANSCLEIFQTTSKELLRFFVVLLCFCQCFFPPAIRPSCSEAN